MKVENFLLLLFLLASSAFSAPIACDYSCPAVDLAGGLLVRRPSAIGYDSRYSFFDCVYQQPHELTVHTCKYYKTTGLKALGYTGDECLTQANQCSEGEILFSGQDSVVLETPPWVVNDRYLQHLTENHPPKS